MKWNGTVLCTLMVGLLAEPGLQAAIPTTSTNHFGVIVERNVFNLVSPRTQQTDPPPRPLAKITLKGTFTFPGDRHALLKVEMPGSLPEPQRNFSLILKEGEKVDAIRLLDMDEKTGTVKVDNDGTIIDLRFNSP